MTEASSTCIRVSRQSTLCLQFHPPKSFSQPMSTRLALSAFSPFVSSYSSSWLQPKSCRAWYSRAARHVRGSNGSPCSAQVGRVCRWLLRFVRSSNKKTTQKPRYFHSTRPSLEPKDPYQVLGVKKDASAADIKKVYFSVRNTRLWNAFTPYLTQSHQLARKYHPDTNPDKNAQVKFVEIQEAYDVRSRQLAFIQFITFKKL